MEKYKRATHSDRNSKATTDKAVGFLQRATFLRYSCVQGILYGAAPHDIVQEKSAHLYKKVGALVLWC